MKGAYETRMTRIEYDRQESWEKEVSQNGESRFRLPSQFCASVIFVPFRVFSGQSACTDPS